MDFKEIMALLYKEQNATPYEYIHCSYNEYKNIFENPALTEEEFTEIKNAFSIFKQREEGRVRTMTMPFRSDWLSLYFLAGDRRTWSTHDFLEKDYKEYKMEMSMSTLTEEEYKMVQEGLKRFLGKVKKETKHE